MLDRGSPAAQPGCIMQGAIPHASHRKRKVPSSADQLFRAWRKRIAKSARGWAVILADGMPGLAPGSHAALVREIEAYAWQLLRTRCRASGLNPRQLARPRPDAPRLLPSPDPSCCASAEIGHPPDCPPAGEVHAGGSVTSADPSRPYIPPTVTREVFERFCRWTGMDPGCLGGPEENRAGLVFYLVVFAMLAGPGDSPDRPSLRLFARLRQCREDLTRLIDSLFQGGTQDLHRYPQGGEAAEAPGITDATPYRAAAVVSNAERIR